MARLWPRVAEVQIDARKLARLEIVGKIMHIINENAQILHRLFLCLFECAQHDRRLSLAGDKIAVWFTLGMGGDELPLAAADLQINGVLISEDFPPMSAARAWVLDQIVRVRLDSLV